MGRNRSKYTESDVKNDDKKKPVKKSRNPRISKRVKEASVQRTGLVDQVPFILGTMAATAIRKNNDDAYLRLFELSTASDLHYMEVLAELERIDTKFNLLAHSFELIAQTRRSIDYNAQNLQANAEILIETKRYSEHLETHYFETILETFRVLDPLLDYNYMFSSLHNLDATVELVRKINVHQNLLNNLETIIEAKRNLATNRLRSHTMEVIAEARRSLAVAVSEAHSSEVILSTDRVFDVNEMEMHNNSVNLETERWFRVYLSPPSYTPFDQQWGDLTCFLYTPPMFKNIFDGSGLSSVEFLWKSQTGSGSNWYNVNSQYIGTKYRTGDSLTGVSFEQNTRYRCIVTLKFRGSLMSGLSNYDIKLHSKYFRTFVLTQWDSPTRITNDSTFLDSDWTVMAGWW
jgi:hypothetical protein